MDNSSNRNRRWNDFGFSLYMKRLKKFEKAFMGTVKSDNHSREVYDYKKCVDILIADGLEYLPNRYRLIVSWDDNADRDHGYSTIDITIFRAPEYPEPQ